MKRHVRIYTSYFGYGEQSFMPCEIPNCGRRATDVHHIDCKGMGGNPAGNKDVIENLMGVCRGHHVLYGDKKQYTDFLKDIHKQFMSKNSNKDIKTVPTKQP